MCRWLAYSGDPIPLEALIVQRKYSLDRPEPPLAARGDDDERRRLRRRLVRRRAPGTGPVPERAPGVERPEPARAGVPRVVTLVLLAHPRLDGDGCAGDEHAPLPLRTLALHAQRGRPGVPARAARPDHGDRPGADPGHGGLGRLGGAVPARAHVRAGGRRDHRARADGRDRRGRGRGARGRASDPDDRGGDRRRPHHRRPLLERGRRRGRSTSAPTPARSSSGTPTTTGSSSSRTRPGRWSRSRSGTWRACGTPSPSRRSGSCSPGRTRCASFTPRRGRGCWVTEAFVWGGIAASSLLIGGLLVMWRPISRARRWAS